MKTALIGLLQMKKFWLALIGLASTLFGAWLAKHGFDLSDAHVEKVAESIAFFFGLALSGLALQDQGKEKARIEADRDKAYLNAPAVNDNEDPNHPAADSVDLTKQAGFIRFDTACGILFVALVLFGALMTACTWIKGETTKTARAAVDCGKELAKKEVSQWTPMVKQVVSRATDQSTGKIDWPSVDDATSALRAEGFCVVKKTVADLVAQAADSLVKSSPLTVDPEDAEKNLDALQARRYPGVEFK